MELSCFKKHRRKDFVSRKAYSGGGMTFCCCSHGMGGKHIWHWIDTRVNTADMRCVFPRKKARKCTDRFFSKMEEVKEKSIAVIKTQSHNTSICCNNHGFCCSFPLNSSHSSAKECAIIQLKNDFFFGIKLLQCAGISKLIWTSIYMNTCYPLKGCFLGYWMSRKRSSL